MGAATHGATQRRAYGYSMPGAWRHAVALARVVVVVAAIATAAQGSPVARATRDANAPSPGVGHADRAVVSAGADHGDSVHIRGSRRLVSPNDLTLGVEWTSYQGTKMSRWPLMVKSFGACRHSDGGPCAGTRWYPVTAASNSARVGLPDRWL